MSKQCPQVKLGEVVREERERVGTFDGDGLPVLGVTNVEGVTQTGVEASDDKSKYLRLRPGRFVYNPYRINVGSIGLSSETQDGICSPAYVIFAPTERIDANFLRFFLKSARGNQLINFHGNRGSVRGALRFDDLAEIEIPLPPLAQQGRVVGWIEELAAQINEARTLRRQALEQAEALGATASSKRFRDIKTTKPLSALIADGTTISYGVLVPGPEVEDGIPFIRIQDLVEAPARPSKRISPEIEKAYGRTRLKGGEVLIAVVGATIGKVGVAPDSWRGANIARAVCRIVPSPELDRDFLVYVLRSQGAQEYFHSVTRTLAQPTLNVGQLEQTRIPVPPLAEQRRIVAELDALQAEVDALKRLQAATAVELDALMPSILDKAFRGDL
jgi:restriction endonuclease S subunit